MYRGDSCTRCKRPVFVPDIMCKMHAKDIFAAFYICKTTVLTNITKIKCLQTKNSLQYLWADVNFLAVLVTIYHKSALLRGFPPPKLWYTCYSHQVGWDTLHDEFLKFVEKDRKSKDHDELFDKLKLAVIEASKNKHQWDSKAEDSLVCSLKLISLWNWNLYTHFYLYN